MIAALFDWPTTWSGAFTAVAVMVLFGTSINYAIRHFGGHHKEQEDSGGDPRNDEIPSVPIKEGVKPLKEGQTARQQIDNLIDASERHDAEIANIKAELLRIRRRQP